MRAFTGRAGAVKADSQDVLDPDHGYMVGHYNYATASRSGI
jgi:hypothetical protein